MDGLKSGARFIITEVFFAVYFLRMARLLLTIPHSLIVRLFSFSWNNYNDQHPRLHVTPSQSLQIKRKLTQLPCASVSKRGLVNIQARVVRKVDDALHRINHYPVDIVWFVSLTLIHLIAIYPVNSVIQSSKNWGQLDLNEDKFCKV